MRMFGAVTTFVLAFGLASGVQAADKVERMEAVAVATAQGDIVEAGVERYMKQLPQMTYKVGDKETQCGYSAASLAKASGSSVAYLVGGSSFECKKSAMNKLASLMEAELANSAAVKTSVAGECYHCPMTAAAMAKKNNTQIKYMVAGIEFDSQKEASTVADRLAAKMKEFGATTVSGTTPCAKTAASTAPCSKSAGSTAPCSKSAKVASTSAKSKGCCKGEGCAKAAAGGVPCDKSAEAATASATGGCSKSKDAKTASAKGGCSKSKAAANAKVASADAKGCCKDKAKAKANAVVASADAPANSTLKLGCCSKKKTGEAAKVAQVASKDTEATSEDTPELARAKQMVREIVEFVAAAKNS
ncbi:MAG: hypothetical protein DHS20C16_36560 [Phycisphaerae bacterium]|nr:MAG: hypothetical protein DHS20C16_36560 [Phycisphaerae bacterium]